MDAEGSQQELTRCEPVSDKAEDQCIFGGCEQQATELLKVKAKYAIGLMTMEARLCAKHASKMVHGTRLGLTRFRYHKLKGDDDTDAATAKDSRDARR